MRDNGESEIKPNAFVNRLVGLLKELKLFKHTKILVVLKPGKPRNDVRSYRPISLLSVCYKLLERLIYNRIAGIINNIIRHD